MHLHIDDAQGSRLDGMSRTKKHELPTSTEVQSKNPGLWTSLIAGGCAGATSRTIVSPLERLKSAYDLVRTKH